MDMHIIEMQKNRNEACVILYIIILFKTILIIEKNETILNDSFLIYYNTYSNYRNNGNRNSIHSSDYFKIKL